MKLLLSQKNLLFDLIEKSELTASLFKYKEKYSGGQVNETMVIHNESSFYFSLKLTSDNSIYVKYSPGWTRYEVAFYSSKWDDVATHFKIWLSYLKREIQQEDKWEKLNSEVQSLQLYKDENDSFNSKFTVPEYLEIKQKIYQLKEGVSKLELLPEQISILNDKLDMVLDMTSQLGRFDWKSLFVGTIVSIIIQLGVTQDNAQAIWALIRQVFHNYFIGQ